MDKDLKEGDVLKTEKSSDIGSDQLELTATNAKLTVIHEFLIYTVKPPRISEVPAMVHEFLI